MTETTYQRGHEPAGAPVTWEYIQDYDMGGDYVFILPDRSEAVAVNSGIADAICATFHAATEWRRLAEEAAADTCPMQVNADWMARFASAKETFGD